MSKSDEAFLLQEKISKLIDKLDKLGFEFMFFTYSKHSFPIHHFISY